MLVLDIGNALAERIGERGVPRGEIERLEGAASRARERLDARRRTGEIGFLDLPFDPGPAAAVEEFVSGLDDSVRDVVILGIGGSSLGPKALYRALCHPYHAILSAARRTALAGGRPSRRLFFLENVDPASARGLMQAIDLRRTLVVAITKSGGTAETLAQLLVLWAAMEKKVGAEGVAGRFVFVTDPERGVLRRVARERGVRTFEIPPNVGGRFSVLTPVGLLPAALAGIDVRGLLAGAAATARACEAPGLFETPAHLFAALHVAAIARGRPIHVLMPYSDALRELSEWFRQLWAESLGKRLDREGRVVEVGPTPVGAVGATDQHSQLQLFAEGPHDKLIAFVAVRGHGRDVRIPALFGGHDETTYLGGSTLGRLLDAERRAVAVSLARAGRPNLTIEIPAVTPAAIGALVMLLEIATAVAGEMMNIDPFDQPGVEEGKRLTFGLMGRPGYDERRAEVTKWERSDEGTARVEVNLP